MGNWLAALGVPTWLLSKEFWLAMAGAALFCAGWYFNGLRWENKQIAQVQRSAEVGVDLQRTANQAEVNYVDRLRDEKERQEQRAKQYRAALHQSRIALDGCRVDVSLLRLLNNPDATAPAGVPAEPVRQGEAPQADTTCTAVVDTYYWNVENVVRPNQIQLDELSAFYRRVRAEYCAKTKAC